MTLFEKIKNRYFLLLKRIISREKIGVNNKEVFEGLGENSICIDCGANKGDVIEVFRSYGAEVFAFEPHPGVFKRLEKRYEGDQKVHLMQKAVWDKEVTLPLYFHKDSFEDEKITGQFASSASLMSEKTNIKNDSFVEVQSVSLSDFINHMGKEVNFLKIDIEGAELEVVEDLIKTKAIDKVQKVFVETHELKVPGLLIGLYKLRLKLFFLGIKKINFDWN